MPPGLAIVGCMVNCCDRERNHPFLATSRCYGLSLLATDSWTSPAVALWGRVTSCHVMQLSHCLGDDSQLSPRWGLTDSWPKPSLRHAIFENETFPKTKYVPGASRQHSFFLSNGLSKNSFHFRDLIPTSGRRTPTYSSSATALTEI